MTTVSAISPPGHSGRRGSAPGGLFDRYLVRGAAGPFLVILPAVVLALMLERALRLIHELAATGADIGYLLPLLVQLLPYYLELAIPLAFMAALVMLVSRLDERLELEAMLATGLSFTRIAAPLVSLGLVLAGLGLIAGGWLEPLGRHGFRTLRIEAVNAGRIGALQPLAMFRPSDDLAVTYDMRAPDGGMRGIFLWQRLENGEERVASGTSGRIGFAPGAREFGIDFRQGRYIVTSRSGKLNSIDFGSFGFRQDLPTRDSRWQRGSDPKELTLSELIAEVRTGDRGHARATVEIELYTRIARALLIPLVPLLVLPLAFATKKQGRALGVLLCAAFVAVSRHVVGLARNFAEMGAADPALLLLGTTGVLALLTMLLFTSGRNLPSHSPLHSLLDPASTALGRLAPKAHKVGGWRRNALGAYLVRELGKWTLLALLTVTMLLQMIDIVEQGDVFVKRGFGIAEIGRYALLRLPAILQQSAPIAALAGAIAAFALLASRHEVTAMRAAGVSQWKILTRMLPVPMVLLAAVFVLAEWATPSSELRLASWWEASAPAASDDAAPVRWFRIGSDIVRADASSDSGGTLTNVRIYRRDDQGRLSERISAARAVRGAAGWELVDTESIHFSGAASERSTAARLAWDVPLQQRDVASLAAPIPALSAAVARRSLALAAPVSQAKTLFATRVHRSAAEPLAALAMLLFALPLAFTAPRTGRSWPALLYAGAAGLIYLLGDGVLTVAAQVGYVPPLLGAWAAPVLAILTGLTVLVYSER